MDGSEALLVVLFAVSLMQIVMCFDAGRGLLHSPLAANRVDSRVQLTTNAPRAGKPDVMPMSKSAGFPIGINRG